MVDRRQIRDRLVGILQSGDFNTLQLDLSNLSEETSLLNDVFLDSIQLLEFIVAIENAFGFAVNVNTLHIDIFDRFGRVIDFVEKSLPAGSATATGGQSGKETA